MYWHIDADIITFIILTALYIYDIRVLPKGNPLQDSRFKLCLCAGIVVSVIDIAASVVMEVPTSFAIYQTLMMLYFIAIEFVIVLWFFYTLSILYHNDNKRRRIISWIILTPFVLYVLAVLSNPWTGIIFTLSGDGVYARGPLFFLMVALYAVYAVALLVLIIVRRKHVPKFYPTMVLASTPIILAVSIPVQLMNPGWLMILPAYMICLVLAFLFFETARSRSEYVQMAELTELQQRLSDIIQNVPSGICMYRWDGEELFSLLANSRLGEMLGEEDIENLIGVKSVISSHIHPADLQGVRKACNEGLHSTGYADVTYRSLNKTTDQYIWIRMRGRMLTQPDGERYVFVSYNDVTQEHLNEQQLRVKYELEKNKPALKEDALRVHSLFNLTTGETLEYFYADGSVVPEDDRTAFEFGHRNANRLLLDDVERGKYLAMHDREGLLDCFARGETELALEYRRRMPDGETKWIRNILHMVHDPRNADVLLFEYWYDIEDEKMQELMYQSLANDNFDYVALIYAATKHFAALTKKGVTYHMPPERGEDADALSLSAYNDSVHPDDRAFVIKNSLIDTITDNLKKEPRFQFTYRDVQQDGAVRYKKLTQYYIDEQREIIAMTREDVTELIRAEAMKNEMLATALDTANQASEAKSHFLSRVSHELRTPLNAIIGFMELAKDADTDKTREYLTNSNLAAKQLLSIINDVLDVSSIEAGKMKLSLKPFDFKYTVSFITNTYSAQCQRKGLTFETSLLTPVDEMLIGDQMRVNQILMNLLNNSLKFTQKGSISLKISQMERDESSVFVCFQVSDTGCGMSEDMLGRLFRPFEQESSATAQKFGGNGLGLSIVKSLVSMMNGHISVSSTQGVGSTFTVDLPFARVKDSGNEIEPADIGAISAEAKEADLTGSLSGHRVLLAEDNAMNRMVAEGLIEKLGVECKSAADGKQAVDMFLAAADNYYDAILMDIQMPVMDGFEATAAIRGSAHPRAKTVPIIALTANAFNEDIAKTLASGMDAHVAKPIEPEVLAKALRKAFLD